MALPMNPAEFFLATTATRSAFKFSLCVSSLTGQEAKASLILPIPVLRLPLQKPNKNRFSFTLDLTAPRASGQSFQNALTDQNFLCLHLFLPSLQILPPHHIPFSRVALSASLLLSFYFTHLASAPQPRVNSLFLAFSRGASWATRSFSYFPSGRATRAWFPQVLPCLKSSIFAVPAAKSRSSSTRSPAAGTRVGNREYQPSSCLPSSGSFSSFSSSKFSSPTRSSYQ